ncbi:hypothetical protein AB0J82_11635 [Asanoa sp. NPDC049518]|uniref:hypothetical protein n=1 Tax=unclassified Asanoa TaxID=2685164 RepID=UPI003425188E
MPKAREPEDVAPMLRTVLDGWSVFPTDLRSTVLGLGEPRSCWSPFCRDHKLIGPLVNARATTYIAGAVVVGVPVMVVL